MDDEAPWHRKWPELPAKTPSLIALEDVPALTTLYWNPTTKTYDDFAGNHLIGPFRHTDKGETSMKIEAKEPGHAFDVDGYDIPEGRIGVCEKGKYWYRTGLSLACLSSPGDSYQSVIRYGTVKVRVLPAGTVLTITI